MQLKQGTILQGGKYEIVRMLGQGGFGITYEAIQVSLGRKVAIKEFFMKEYSDRDADTSYVTLGSSQGSRELVEKFRTKFLREARMIASQDHPNIVKIYDVFEENGTAYYVMEHLSGGSLADLVKQHGPLDEKSARDYITQVGSALSHLHEQNCLHFDVKPSNILLNRFGKAVLIDFGISKHYDQGGNQTSSTPVGISKGFAPLEQYQQAEIETFTPATDIYALGATFYYLVAGKTPPSASEVNEDGLERPSGLSDQSWHVIERAMQPRRKDRPQSIAAFLQLFDEAPAAEKDDDDDETVVITKKEPVKAEKKRSKTWLWVVLGIVAVAAIVPVIIPGKKLTSPPPETEMAALDTVETVVTREPVEQQPVKEQPVKQQPVQQKPQESSSPKKGYDNGYEWVDLGLPSGTKWATCNVGASSPGDYGNYYAWGETSTKSAYHFGNVKYGDGWQYTKYVPSSKPDKWSGSGSPDNKTSLDLSDDAARANWGGKWKTPTRTQWDELSSKCKWSWTGSGYKVIGPNGQSITLPAAGYRDGSFSEKDGSAGYYWSSSLFTNYPENARYMYFTSKEHIVSFQNRRYGGSARPVTE